MRRGSLRLGVIRRQTTSVSLDVSGLERRDSEGVSDDALLSGIVLGDDHAALTFVRRYQRRLFGLAFGIVGDPLLAEDVTQEAFVRIFRYAAVFDPRRGTAAAWSLTVTRNLAIDAMRMHRAVPVSPEDRVFLELVSQEAQPDEAALLTEAVGRARIALAKLPVEQRRAVVLASIYGRTCEEIAVAESIPVGTAKSRIRLGMAKLRNAIVVVEDS